MNTVNMDFERTIEEIINSIKQRDFLNEAEVTNGIVMRVLNSLGWNVFDTGKVKPQYGIDGKKIDFALCYPDNKPLVIIEVKALGKAVNTDEQVLIYSFKTGIPIAILTDGQEWHFYLPAERGSLTERRFYKLDLLEREPLETIEILNVYLGYDAIRNGSALKRAKSDYEQQYINKEINASIPNAWNKLLLDKDYTLIMLIAEKAADLCGYMPSEETIIDFLKGLNNPPQESSQKEKPTVSVRLNKITTNTDIYTEKEKFRGVKLNNRVFEISNNSIGTLESLLKLAITHFPKALDRIQNQTTGRSRALISRHKSDLYKNRTDLESDRSKQLPNGWWFGNNYSRREILKFCDIVASSITHEYGNQNIDWII